MQEQISEYQEKGFVIARGLFSQEEVAHYREHYTALRENGTAYPGDFAGLDLTSSDPLKRYPRMIHMHRWDTLSRHWLMDERINHWLTALLGCEPYAVQTMLYFKPAGGRGQALHQDQYYLKVQPGTCMAAWLALDDCDEENGCLQVVPGTHELPILCTVDADTTQSFTDVTVPLAEGMQPVPCRDEGGRCALLQWPVDPRQLPQHQHSRFRRSLIGHYIMGDAEKVAKYYHPALRMDGSEIILGTSEGGSECGVWVEKDGAPALALQAVKGPSSGGKETE